jgi:response regulator RpfG family c-di-GMP phosphodiesterase
MYSDYRFFISTVLFRIQSLKGDEIPIAGRLMAIADVYDALISKRVYKPAFSHEKAGSMLVEGRGAHFDPDMMDAFLEIETEFTTIPLNFQTINNPGSEKPEK